MPVPFKDLTSDQDSGVAGYLKFVAEEDDKGIQGALFLVSSRERHSIIVSLASTYIIHSCGARETQGGML